LTTIALTSDSPAATSAIAAAIAAECRAGDLLVLAGEMGAGKTAFAQGFGAALGITDPITSPTFTLVHTYDARTVTLHHADVYRLERMGELADLALGELLEAGGILLVEWGDVVAGALGDHLEIRLIANDFDQVEHRSIEVRAMGSTWAKRWDRLVGVLNEWTV
jgi:tRNA threonylcarbamoyladenosine biosynthesis protein TsaE